MVRNLVQVGGSSGRCLYDCLSFGFVSSVKPVRLLGGSNWNDAVDIFLGGDLLPPPVRVRKHVENRDIWRMNSAKIPQIKGIFKTLNLNDQSVVRMLELYASASPESDTRSLIQAALGSYRATGLIPPLIDAVSDRRYLTEAQSGVVRSVEEFRSDHQMANLLRKYPFQGNEEVTRFEAVKAFAETEKRNKCTNDRWRTEEPSGFFETLCDRLENLLGPCPTLDEVIDKGAWGPGTTVDFPYGSDLTCVELKTASPISCFERNLSLIPRVLRRVPLWNHQMAATFTPEEGVNVVGASKMATVPKDSTKDRVIFVEPLLEGFLQHGLAAHLRAALQRESRDLSYAWTTNQKLAHAGSCTGQWCTVDLRAASDSICICPLKSLLSGTNSAQWFRLMDTLRSKVGSVLCPASTETSPLAIADELHRFELFSSMGNGYTFELESVLFYALLTTIIPGIWVRDKGQLVLRWPHISVFGDDLVFPVAYAPQVVASLEWLGFQINTSKSFFDGPFRESCGKDYYLGQDVRPLFLSRQYQNASSIIDLANRVLCMGSSISPLGDIYNRLVDDRWGSIHRHLLRKIPGVIRDLQSTPDRVPQGLWLGEWGPRSEQRRGHLVYYKLFSPIPDSLNLERYWLSSPVGVNSWRIVPALGSNVLLASLRQITEETSVFSKHAVTKSGRAVFRGAVTFAPRLVAG